MDRTAEVRWFVRGPAPAAVAAWFDAAAARPPQTRADRYLVLPGTDALGVKVRGGTARLEFKLRPRPPEPLSLPAAGSGDLERWQRWSLPRPAVSRLVPRLGLPKDRWRTVRKERRLVTLPYGGGAGTGASAAGCRVELTALEVDGDRWSTVGFESYGPEPDLVPALRSAAERFFASIDLPGGLGAERSCGYPGWLATL